MWEKVAKLGDFTEGQGQIAKVGSQEIALFKIDGKVYAIDNLCPHQGGPLGEGSLEGAKVRCPWHAWNFDVTSGVCGNAPEMNQKTFPVKLEGDDVFVEVA